MNIFALDQDPDLAAQYMVDRHVVKMILESAQLLSTAHRVLDGELYIDETTGRKIKRWRLPNEVLDRDLYKATHINHPSAVWCRECTGNYSWLFQHFNALLGEYTHRYGKVHACDRLATLLVMQPSNIVQNHDGTSIKLAMPDEYKISDDPVECYRQYYRIGKARMHSWKNREVPSWLAPMFKDCSNCSFAEEWKPYLL